MRTYETKHAVILSEQQIRTLDLAYGWTRADIKHRFGISTKKAREIFNIVKQRYGCLPLLSDMVATENVLALLKLKNKTKEKEKDYEK